MILPEIPIREEVGGKEEEDDEEEEDALWSSDSEVGDALDWLDTREVLEGSGAAISGSIGYSQATSRRPNAHGGLLSRPLQPLSNRSQKSASHIRATPLEEWEGRLDFGMSNSVTTAIRDNIREMAIGRTKNTEKADRASVEQAIDPRTRMVLFKMLNRGIFNDINGCISTGKEANVYHATRADGKELAIKVYKTSILVLKTSRRCRYLVGNMRRMDSTALLELLLLLRILSYEIIVLGILLPPCPRCSQTCLLFSPSSVMHASLGNIIVQVFLPESSRVGFFILI